MHERSLAALLIEQIEEERRIRRLGTLTGVRVALGEFAGVEPVLLSEAFAELSHERWGRYVPLLLDVVPLVARCRRCTAEFRVERFRFICPTCDQGDVDIVSGEEIQLVSLKVERTTTKGEGTG